MPGYIDPDSGTRFYAADDAAGPMSTVLNLAANAEHNARLADRARLDGLEASAMAIHTIVPSAFLTLASGYTLESGAVQVVRRIGARIEFSLRIKKTSGAFVHGVPVATVKTTYAPISGSEWQLTAQESGGGTNAGSIAAVIASTREIRPLNPNGVSNVLAVSGFFHTI